MTQSNDREEHFRVVNVIISTGEKPPGNRVFHSVQLTDEIDLLFLYVVEITEQEFLALKQEQCLKVDYQEFPVMLSHLFESCINSSQDDYETYRSIIDLTKPPEAHFSIVEEKKHKSMPHLVLKLRQANDEQLKKYLARCLSVSRKENEKLREFSSDQTEKIQIQLSDLDRLQEQLRSFENERNAREVETKSSYEKLINQLKSDSLARENRSLESYEADKKQTEQRFLERERSLSEKSEKFERLSSELNQRRMELEADLKDAQGKLRILEKENLSRRLDTEKMQGEYSELIKYKHEVEREVSALKVGPAKPGAVRVAGAAAGRQVEAGVEERGVDADGGRRDKEPRRDDRGPADEGREARPETAGELRGDAEGQRGDRRAQERRRPVLSS